MNPTLRKLLHVANATPDVWVKVHLLAAIKKADDVIRHDAVEEGVTLDEGRDPLDVLLEEEDLISTVFVGLAATDDLVSAASSVTTSLAGIINYLNTIAAAVPNGDLTESNTDTEKWTDFRSSLEDVRGQIEALQPWALKIKEIANANPASPHPEFPSVPTPDLPSPVGEEEGGEGEEEPAEEEPAEDPEAEEGEEAEAGGEAGGEADEEEDATVESLLNSMEE